MSPRRYRRRPIEVEAVQWTGDNVDEVRAFCGGDKVLTSDATIAIEVAGKRGERFRTLHVGEWITRNTLGSLVKWPPDRFDATYEPVEPAGDTEGVEA